MDYPHIPCKSEVVGEDGVDDLEYEVEHKEPVHQGSLNNVPCGQELDVEQRTSLKQ